MSLIRIPPQQFPQQSRYYMPDEVKKDLSEMLSPMLVPFGLIVVLIAIAAVSIMVLGKDNAVEKDCEKVIEAEVSSLK